MGGPESVVLYCMGAREHVSQYCTGARESGPVLLLCTCTSALSVYSDPQCYELSRSVLLV